MNRVYAALIHMSISFLVFLIVAYLILIVWFPDFFFAIDGGFEGIRILIGVDLVLGPILTFVVYKKGKPGLKFDLSVIGFVQASCLLAGLWVIYTERPIFFIYYDKHFYSVSADTYLDYGAVLPDYRQYSDETPARVFVDLPDNPIEEADIRKLLYDDNIPLWTYAKLYRPLDEHIDTVISEGVSESVIRQRDTEGHLDEWLERNGGEFSDYAFVPVHSRYSDAFLGIRKSSKEILSVVTVPPPIALPELEQNAGEDA